MHLLFIVNWNATSQFSHHWENVAVIVDYRDNAGTQDEYSWSKWMTLVESSTKNFKAYLMSRNTRPCDSSWERKCKQTYRKSPLFQSTTKGSKASLLRSTWSTSSTGTLGKTIKIELIADTCRSWLAWFDEILKQCNVLVRVCTVSYRNGFRTAKYRSTEIHMNV